MMIHYRLLNWGNCHESVTSPKCLRFTSGCDADESARAPGVATGAGGPGYTFQLFYCLGSVEDGLDGFGARVFAALRFARLAPTAIAITITTPKTIRMVSIPMAQATSPATPQPWGRLLNRASGY
jgi:hypothetical protein